MVETQQNGHHRATFYSPSAFEAAREAVENQAVRDAALREEAVRSHIESERARAEEITEWKAAGRAEVLQEIANANEKEALRLATENEMRKKADEKAIEDRKQATEGLLDLEVQLAIAKGTVDGQTQIFQAATDKVTAVSAAHTAGRAHQVAINAEVDIRKVASASGDKDIKTHYGLERPEEAGEWAAPEGFKVQVVPDVFPEPKTKLVVFDAQARTKRGRRFGRKTL